MFVLSQDRGLAGKKSKRLVFDRLLHQICRRVKESACDILVIRFFGSFGKTRSNVATKQEQQLGVRSIFALDEGDATMVQYSGMRFWKDTAVKGRTIDRLLALSAGLARVVEYPSNKRRRTRTNSDE